MRSKRSLRLALVGLLALLGALPLRADIEPGIFVLRTSPLVPMRLQDSFAAGFFDTGSDEVVFQDINLQGVPLATQPGTPTLEQGDTVIELLSTVDFPSNQPAQRTVSARVVTINLTSSAPLTVTYNGANPELWDVRVCNSSVLAQDSRISFINQCETAGTFMAAIAIRPRLIFTRQRDGRQVFQDPGAAGFLSFLTQGYWVKRSFQTASFFEVAPGAVIDANCDGVYGTTLPGTSDAILGLQRVNCNTLLPNQGYVAIQPILLTEHYALEPATRDERSLPSHESAAPGRSTQRQGALKLGSLGLLGVAAAAIRPRRRRRAEQDDGPTG